MVLKVEFFLLLLKNFIFYNKIVIVIIEISSHLQIETYEQFQRILGGSKILLLTLNFDFLS